MVYSQKNKKECEALHLELKRQSQNGLLWDTSQTEWL